MRPQEEFKHIANCCDLRKYVRYNDGAMCICFKRQSFLHELRKAIEVDWINFNQYGFCFSSDIRLEMCEQIIVNIKTPDHNMKGLVAIIHNARRQGGQYRYGAQFYYGANSYMQSPDIQETLALIELDLK
jgi:hypothetical protein